MKRTTIIIVLILSLLFSVQSFKIDFSDGIEGDPITNCNGYQGHPNSIFAPEFLKDASNYPGNLDGKVFSPPRCWSFTIDMETEKLLKLNLLHIKLFIRGNVNNEKYEVYIIAEDYNDYNVYSDLQNVSNSDGKWLDIYIHKHHSSKYYQTTDTYSKLSYDIWTSNTLEVAYRSVELIENYATDLKISTSKLFEFSDTNQDFIIEPCLMRSSYLSPTPLNNGKWLLEDASNFPVPNSGQIDGKIMSPFSLAYTCFQFSTKLKITQNSQLSMLLFLENWMASSDAYYKVKAFSIQVSLVTDNGKEIEVIRKQHIPYVNQNSPGEWILINEPLDFVQYSGDLKLQIKLQNDLYVSSVYRRIPISIGYIDIHEQGSCSCEPKKKPKTTKPPQTTSPKPKTTRPNKM